ncbi:uncharacterized mitochondrial protein AtMg00810-like [Hibiscus syriacus]|uniref:uncharacterized mitochondrial protein AtMg00810-like n=1 Tax=Hibiscus syriacus TaxID=106335 RepID=UPI00192088CB|nr:uncharacterized mitochondrial protein AtMg00810-like [Hibiscus syriacus]
MTKASCTSTPMVASSQLKKDEGQLLPDAREFQSLVGGLLYVCHTRPDIAFSVNKVAQYMHAPREQHMLAAKRILRYLGGTLDYGLGFVPGKLYISAFSDVDWGGCVDDRRSMSGYYVFVGGSLVTWSAKK